MQNKIPSSKPYFPLEMRKNILADIDAVLASGRLTMGPWIEKFEQKFAEITGCKHAVALNSGTAPLEILLRFHGVKNAEVIVPTNTFLASANAVQFAGGTPVLSDINPETLCIDVPSIEAKLTGKTRGVIVVHIAGLIPPQMPDIRRFCHEKSLFLIEDAAHAAGAGFQSIAAGNWSDGGAFSFFPTKIVTTGEGGMLTTNNDRCADFARSLRCHGIGVGEDIEKHGKNRFVRLGHNWRMSEMQAVIGYHQLEMLDDMVAKRNRVADFYTKAFRESKLITPFKTPNEALHSFYKYPVFTQNSTTREMLAKRMREDFAIDCGSIYWPPVHRQPFYARTIREPEKEFPHAENILPRTLALPMHPALTDDELHRIAEAIFTIEQSV